MKRKQNKLLSLTSEKIRVLRAVELHHVDGGEYPISKIARCGSAWACE